MISHLWGLWKCGLWLWWWSVIAMCGSLRFCFFWSPLCSGNTSILTRCFLMSHRWLGSTTYGLSSLKGYNPSLESLHRRIYPITLSKQIKEVNVGEMRLPSPRTSEKQYVFFFVKITSENFTWYVFFCHFFVLFNCSMLTTKRFPGISLQVRILCHKGFPEALSQHLPPKWSRTNHWTKILHPKWTCISHWKWGYSSQLC